MHQYEPQCKSAALPKKNKKRHVSKNNKKHAGSHNKKGKQWYQQPLRQQQQQPTPGWEEAFGAMLDEALGLGINNNKDPPHSKKTTRVPNNKVRRVRRQSRRRRSKGTRRHWIRDRTSAKRKSNQVAHLLQGGNPSRVPNPISGDPNPILIGARTQTLTPNLNRNTTWLGEAL